MLTDWTLPSRPASSRRLLWFGGLLLSCLFALTGCGPRSGSGSGAGGTGDFLVDLPSVYVDFGEDGVATVGGMSISQAGMLIGRSLPDLDIPLDLLEDVQEFNIQHVQLVNTDRGLDILVNGLRMPSLAWSIEALDNLRALIERFELDLGMAGNVLPLLGNFNAGVVLRFPLTEGVDELPLTDPQAAAVAQRAQEAAAILAAGAGDIPVVHVTMEYAADGSWTVQAQDSELLTADTLEERLPLGIWASLDLEPDRIESIQDAQIESILITTDEEGVHFAVNDMGLPSVTWGSGEINNVIRLVEESGLLAKLSNEPARMAALLDIGEQLLPTVQAADFSMEILFPTP